jgi:hypothetical protein
MIYFILMLRELHPPEGGKITNFERR